MSVKAPHFLLFSDAARKADQGHWRFVLEATDGSERFSAADDEPEIQGERLELLAVVRGLEALPRPARVTLVTPSEYVNRGLAYGLDDWRSNGWQWEHFGEMVPVKNRDLWQRIDRILQFHELECWTWRIDGSHAAAKPPQTRFRQAAGSPRRPARLPRTWSPRRLLGVGRRCLAGLAAACRLRPRLGAESLAGAVSG